jgi:hypothetical protein
MLKPTEQDPAQDGLLLEAVEEIRKVIAPLLPEQRQAVLLGALVLYGHLPWRPVLTDLFDAHVHRAELHPSPLRDPNG